MFFRILLWSFIIVMIFRFIARFIFPILGMSKIAQDKIRQMQQQMNDMQHQQTKTSSSSTNKTKVGDYIDYEEIK